MYTWTQMSPLHEFNYIQIWIKNPINKNAIQNQDAMSHKWDTPNQE